MGKTTWNDWLPAKNPKRKKIDYRYGERPVEIARARCPTCGMAWPASSVEAARQILMRHWSQTGHPRGGRVDPGPEFSYDVQRRVTLSRVSEEDD